MMDFDHLAQGVALGYGGLGLSAQGKAFSNCNIQSFTIQRDKAIRWSFRHFAIQSRGTLM
jgi:hypothetical protein